MSTSHIFFNTNSSKTFIPEDNAVRLFDTGFSKSMVLKYLSVYAQIEDSDINVPLMRKFFKAAEGGWAILQQNIQGLSLHEVFCTQLEEPVNLVNRLIDTQLRINEKVISDLCPINDKLAFQIKELDFSDEKKEELNELLSEMPRGNTLINGNLGLHNIVTSVDDRAYVLDWSEMTCGVPEAECANTYLLLACGSTEIAEQYLKIYSKRTGASVEAMRKWIPLMGVNQLHIGVMSELHREMILPWLDLYRG